MIYYVLVLFCQKTAEIYIPLSLNCKYMMNQNSSGFLSSIPMVTKNLIIINLLFWVASLVLPKVGIDLVQLFGLHFPGVKDFYPFQFVTYMFIRLRTCFSICSVCICSDACWRMSGGRSAS